MDSFNLVLMCILCSCSKATYVRTNSINNLCVNDICGESEQINIKPSNSSRNIFDNSQKVTTKINSNLADNVLSKRNQFFHEEYVKAREKYLVDHYKDNPGGNFVNRLKRLALGSTRYLQTSKNLNVRGKEVNGVSNSRSKRASISNKEKLWTYGIIPYEIDGNYSGAHKAMFKQAMRHWENYTCLSFVERNPEEHPNYIVFVEKACGCCSFVGMKGSGPQVISIGKNCDKFGNVVHEIGHVIGFWHEHTRPDRDKYLKINYDNIIAGQEYNFNVRNDIDSLQTKYDYVSVMHYSTRTFSKNPYLETLTVPENLPDEILENIGQRNALSLTDIEQTNLLYNCPTCGKTFQGNSANFSSTSFVDKKAPNEGEVCVWRIQGTHGEKIVLNITDLDIPKSENCQSDYLEILDGYWHKSKVLQKLCGTMQVNESIVSTSSRMLVKYVSKNPSGHRGFVANYETVCGGELFVENEGHLESPNFPMEYRANKKCVWKLSVPENYQVALKFQSFHVENHEKCFYDYVEIRDGLGVERHPLNERIPDRQIINSQSLERQLVEGQHVNGHGITRQSVDIQTFEGNSLEGQTSSAQSIEEQGEHFIDRQSLDGPTVSGTIPNGKPINIQTLNGQTISGQSFSEQILSVKPLSGQIFDENNLIGQTIDGTPDGKPIDVRTIDGRTIDSRIRSGTTIDEKAIEGPLLGLFCGPNLPPDVRSTSNHMVVKFNSDSSIGNSGFSAIFLKEYDECKNIEHGCVHECINTLGSYKCACKIGYELHADGKNCEVSCGGILEAPNGTFSSPSFPDYYPPNKHCIWEVRAPLGYLITVNFTHFDIDEFDLIREECITDKIDVYSKVDKEEMKHHGTFCGTRSPKPMTSRSNVMRFVFSSDREYQSAGFAALYHYYLDQCASDNGGCQHYCVNDFGKYSCACQTGYALQEGKKLCKEKCVYKHTKPAGQIQSLNYPAHYEKDLECAYHFITKPGHRIRVRFIDFDLDDNSECMHDYVQFHNGDSVKSWTLTQRYCGATLPHVAQSFSNELFMVFHSTYGDKKGFQATYITVCGGQLRATFEEKFIYSHALYGEENYNDNMYCTWYIEPPPDSNVRISFKNFDLEYNPACKYDFVLIMDDLDYSERAVGKFCDKKIPEDIESSEGALKVIFKTDGEGSGKGFVMTYVAVEQAYINSEEIIS